MNNYKKSTWLYVLIAIMCILVAAFSGYLIFNSFKNNKTDLVSKVYNNKEWIYDAEYSKNVVADSYQTSYQKYYAKDIIVPYINIDSTYTNSSNKEIKKIFDDAIETYNTGVNDKITYVEECGYKKYLHDNNLSIILTYGVGATDVVYPNYYTYNINLKTGEELSYEEVYSIAGLNSSNVDSKVKNAITKALKEEIGNVSLENYPDGTNFETYNKESINNYEKSVSNNTIRYFLSDNDKLSVVVNLSIPAGHSQFDTIITID